MPKIIQLLKQPDGNYLLGLDENGDIWRQDYVPGKGYEAQWRLWLPNNKRVK